MERFYARIPTLMGDTVVVKGGLVLERRLERARHHDAKLNQGVMNDPVEQRKP